MFSFSFKFFELITFISLSYQWLMVKWFKFIVKKMLLLELSCDQMDSAGKKLNFGHKLVFTPF